ncbi:hypothetical protein [Mesorhizobium sp. M0195]|uniref:hypothetical protein n=1 Tax=Mesorhizobium sp. M0195 TaxID=2956910 RepID=UPI0033363E80
MPTDVQALCDGIRYYYRQRAFAMEQRKRANLALGSFLRMALGWSLAQAAADRDAIKAKAANLLKIGEAVSLQAGKPNLEVIPGSDGAEYAEWRDLIAASIKARAPFDQVEAATKKEMARLASQLPAWAAFGEGVKGFGAASLAAIVGEAGNLSAYPKKGHLWKRMGVGLVDGVRQGDLPRTASKAAWIAHGYNRQRRSAMWNIGDAMIKTGEAYREVYLARKAFEQAKATEAGLIVAPSAKIPAKRAAEFISDGHIHRRAQRYMEKRLLRDLLQAWKRCEADAEMPPEAMRGEPRSAPKLLSEKIAKAHREAIHA